MQLDGRVADKAPTRDDRKMVADAERARAPSEDAIEEMRRRGRGWMHVRWVQGKAVVVLAEGLGGDRPRVTWYCEGGCESADVPAEEFTGHEAIVMGRAGKDWFTADGRRLGDRLCATLGYVEEDNAREGGSAEAARCGAAEQEAKAAITVVFVYYSGPQTVGDRMTILRKIEDEAAAGDKLK